MTNTLLIGDTIHEIDKAYREGAKAMRDGIPCICNPYRDGSQAHAQWSAGHDNEAAGEHVRFGLDVIAVPPARAHHFDEDPDVPRDEHGCVDAAWHETALALAELITKTATRKRRGTKS